MSTPESPKPDSPLLLELKARLADREDKLKNRISTFPAGERSAAETKVKSEIAAYKKAITEATK